MRKTISLLALAATIMIGAVSCNNGEEGIEAIEKGSGTISIEYGFKDVKITDDTKGPTSTAKPVTSWTKNISSLTLLLTNSSGVITKVMSPTPPTGADITTKSVASIPNLTAGTYNVYLIANASAATVTSPHGAVVINPSLALTEAALVGQNISSLSFNTVAHTGTLPTGITAANQQPSEIFWASKTGITVASTSVTAHLELERIVSLLRVRINKDVPVDGTAVNANVNFAHADAGFVLRRTAGAGFAASTGAVNGTAVDFYYKGAFKTVAPVAADYTGSMNLGTGNDFTLWKDHIILPGGAANVNTGFSIVLVGIAGTGGYKAINISSGAETNVAQGQPIFWTAGVEGAVVKNGIMELNIVLKSKAFTGTVPPPTTYGTLVVTAELEEWGNVNSVTINI